MYVCIRKSNQSPLRNRSHLLINHRLSCANRSKRSRDCYFPTRYAQEKHVHKSLSQEQTYFPTSQCVLYLLDVPDMKSPLSEILILAPLAWKYKLQVSDLFKERGTIQKDLEHADLIDFQYVPPSTTNHDTNMLISNTNCQGVTSIFLHLGKERFNNDTTNFTEIHKHLNGGSIAKQSYGSTI